MITAIIGTVPLIAGLVNPINAAWDCRIIHREFIKEIKYLKVNCPRPKETGSLAQDKMIDPTIPVQYMYWYPYQQSCRIMGYTYTNQKNYDTH